MIAWLGPHATEGGADESGYKFAWSDLREPVIDAVTGAGWTYKPKSSRQASRPGVTGAARSRSRRRSVSSPGARSA